MNDPTSTTVSTGPDGLTDAQATARLAHDGPNVLPTSKGPSRLQQLAGQLVHFFALMLWVAGILAVIAGMAVLGIAIFAVIVINGVFAFIQEFRAERAAERLSDLMPRRATVIRQGRRRVIDASDLVIGDLVWIEGGDRISADMQVSEAHGLSIDTSVLTGESVPVSVGSGDDVYAGTFVVEGEAACKVTATGGQTRLGDIARLTRAVHVHKTPLARELHRVVRFIAIISIGVGAAFLGFGLILGMPLRDGFLFAIGVTVALVPEGLLPTVTLSLAVAAQRMSTRHALVRHLESVETLGSTTFICTDKTGTLTCNEMTVVTVWTPAGDASVDGSGYDPQGTVNAATPEVADAIAKAALIAVRCSSGYAEFKDGHWVAHGDPMEAAIDILARRSGVDAEADELSAPIVARFPFDPRRRRMSVRAGSKILTKGAPDTVLPRCKDVPTAAHEALQDMAKRGLRVLAVASRTAEDTPSSAAEAELELDLAGLLGFEDPPRAEAADAIAACRDAGIKVAMLTGDHPATAAAIGRELGLLLANEDEVVIEGKDLPDDEADLGALLDRDGIVLARVAPEDKLRIATALQERGHVVAMTGDGVNDGPALREADIGIAMGQGGTDVAREAADLVLLDDNFATIVAAVEDGRATFSNVRRFLTLHLSGNVGELMPFLVWALSAGRFPLALSVLQIICIDLGTDVLPALGLGVERPHPWALKGPPTQRRHIIDRSVLGRVFGVLGLTVAVAEMLAFTTALVALGWRFGALPPHVTVAEASGAAFVAIVMGQLANSFSCRSATVSPRRLEGGWAGNKLLVWASVVGIVILGLLLGIPPVARVLGQAIPPTAGWVVALCAVPAVLTADAIHKWVRKRRRMRLAQ